jgi:uncharacterized protein YueI
VDETENKKGIAEIPETSEFTFLNKIIKGQKDEVEAPGVHFTHTSQPQFKSRKSPKLGGAKFNSSPKRAASGGEVPKPASVKNDPPIKKAVVSKPVAKANTSMSVRTPHNLSTTKDTNISVADKDTGIKSLKDTPASNKSTHKRFKSRIINNYKPLAINENKLLRGNEDELHKLTKNDDANAKILKKLYRIHTKFRLVIDEDIEVDRSKIHQRISDLDLQKDKKSLFNFGEKPDMDEYDARVEREIVKLNEQSYMDTCCFIEECFQIEDGDNDFEGSDKEEEKTQEQSQEIKYVMRVSLLNLKKHHSLFLHLSMDT